MPRLVRLQEEEAVKYRPLKDFVARRGGVRLGSHSRFRDQAVEWAVECWPLGVDADKVEEVLRARLALRTREQYGSVLAAFLIPVLVNLVVHIVVRWWESRRENRALMAQWSADAQAPEG